MSKKRICLFLMVIALCSCAHAKIKPSQVSSLPIDVQGVVIDQKKLNTGGVLGLMPLKPGPKAEANDELDRISGLMMVGLTGNLSQSPVYFDDSKDPQLIFEAYLQEYTKKGRFVHLILEGNIWMENTGHRILEFSIEKTFDSKQEKLEHVFNAIGAAIGNFILTHITQKDAA